MENCLKEVNILENKENQNEQENSKLPYSLIVLIVCIILFCLLLGFATFQNLKPKPIYVDPPVDNGTQIVELNKWEYSNPVYRGEPIEYGDLVYRGEPIEFTYLK